MTRSAAPMLLALRLTAIAVLLRPMGPWTVRPLILALAGLALLFPRILESQATWFAMAALIALRVWADWPLPDNHVYLLAYWCLAIALALGAAEPAQTLATSGRWLLGLAFLAAVMWKAALAPDYLDGRFFRVTLLTDGRFADAVQLVGGLTAADLEHNRNALAPLPDGAELLSPPVLVDPPAFTRLVWIATVGLIVAEASIAVVCLVPLATGGALAAHVLLLLFCTVTYAFAPVAGFGWLLLSMGTALCRTDQRVLRTAYVSTWLLVLLYAEVPWARAMLDVMGERS